MKKPKAKKDFPSFKKISRIICTILGILYIIIGLIFIINSLRSITGLAIIDKIPPPTSRIFGVLSVIIGIGHIYLAKRKTRGQAAMEFLLTYGWAVLAMIISLGVLGYYMTGFNFSSSPLVLSSPFYVIASQLNAVNIYSIEVQNNGDKTASISKFEVKSGDTTLCPNTIAQSINIQPGKSAVLSTICSSNQVRGDAKITYVNAGSQLTQISTGTVSASGSGSSGQGGQGGEAVCGNSIIEQGEECDDGNLINGDGCSDLCRRTVECNDQIDNDIDGLTDLEDPECGGDPNGASESTEGAKG